MGAYETMFKNLGPAMGNKSWIETINRETREHMHHPLNPAPYEKRCRSVPIGNQNDFYAGTWSMINKQHVQAAGCPSALVTMARNYTGQDLANSRPATGASAFPATSKYRSHSRPETGASGRSHQ